MKLKVEQWPIERLKNYPKNARTHSDAQVAQIAASIGEFGFVNPVLVDKDGTLIAGHGRLAGARQAGLATVPVIQLGHLTDDQARALRLADNRIQLSGAWDTDMLRFELNELQLAQFDMPLLGFENYELADFMAAPVPEGADPDATPAPPAKPVTRTGDLWVLGKHRLCAGDATNADDVARALDGAKPNLMVTDPPYGVEYDANWRNETGIAEDGSLQRIKTGRGRKSIGAKAIGKVQNDDRADWQAAWILFEGNVAYCWHADRRASDVDLSFRASGFEVRSQIIWNKGRMIIGRGDYHWAHEPCWYLVRSGCKGSWAGDRKQTTMWDIQHRSSETGHSTQKPVECMRRPIQNNSKPGDFVYEPFSGSGTTIIACEMMKRCCRAIEISPAYVDVAVLRWQEFSKQAATLANDGRTFDEITKARGRTNGQAGAQVRADRRSNGLRADGVDASPDARPHPARNLQHPHEHSEPVRVRKGAAGPGQKAQRASLTRQKQKVAPPEPPQA